MIHTSQGYILCPSCGQRHAIRNHVPIQEEGNKYRCAKTVTVVTYAGEDVRRDDITPSPDGVLQYLCRAI